MVNRMLETAWRLVIDGHNWNVVFLQLLSMLYPKMRRANDQTIHPALTHGANDGLFTFEFSIRSCNKEAVSGFSRYIFDSLQYFAEKLVIDPADNDPQSLRAAGFQSPRHGTGDILQIFCNLLDTGDSLRGDGKVPAEGTRNRRVGDPRDLCDIFDRDCQLHHPCCTRVHCGLY